MPKKNGFSDQQKSELVEIFVDQFTDILLPSLDTIVERLDKIENRLTELEERMGNMEIELKDIRRRLKDLENDTVTYKSYIDLRSRVDRLERKVGIAGS